MASRVTPLNIASAVLVVILGYSIFGSATERPVIGTWQLAGVLLLSIVSDIVFRGIVRNLKRIWMIELLFVSLVVALMLIISRIWG